PDRRPGDPGRAGGSRGVARPHVRAVHEGGVERAGVPMARRPTRTPAAGAPHRPSFSPPAEGGGGTMIATVGSPIDPVLLEPVLAPLGQSRTLPAQAYTSEAVLDWELRHFFEGTWVCVSRSADVGSPGNQKAVSAGGERIVLLRDEEGVLRGFYNVCR